MVSLGLGPNLIDRKLGGPESDTSAYHRAIPFTGFSF